MDVIPLQADKLVHFCTKLFSYFKTLQPNRSSNVCLCLVLDRLACAMMKFPHQQSNVLSVDQDGSTGSLHDPEESQGQ